MVKKYKIGYTTGVFDMFWLINQKANSLASYVASGAGKGIVSGNGAGFNPNANITREDMAVMIYNVMKSLGVNFSEVNDTFADYDQISDYAKEAVSALAAKGIINGVGDNMFAPKATATRAQAAVIIDRILGVIPVEKK